MSLNLLKDIKAAYAQLNPSDARRLAERPLSVGIAASSESGYAAIERFLERSKDVLSSPLGGFATVHRISSAPGAESNDFLICEEGSVCPPTGFVFRESNPSKTIEAVLDRLPEFELPLARHFVAFQQPVIVRIIQRMSRENALFSAVTALPNMIPNLLELPWAVGEFATDTAFITMNQVRMAFLIAAANGKDPGYGIQKLEIAAIAAGAFGWRAIARELIGKIPLGGGLIPKAAIAFAGTYVVGLGLERVHRTGKDLTGNERKQAYREALEQGKGIVQQMIPKFKSRNVA